MALPTWHGQPVEPGDPRMAEALSEAPAVLTAAMGDGRLQDLTSIDLLHAVEAASWVEHLAEAGRHWLVPAAKAAGASWADLAQAMGVTRSTAQHRFKQQAEEWEEAVRQQARPPLGASVPALAPMDPPKRFEPSDDEFVRDEKLPAWIYTGPLDSAIQYVRATHKDVKVFSEDGIHYVQSRYEDPERGTPHSASTTADSEEEAWRAHLGLVLGWGHPYPDDARPGETVAALRARTRR